MTTPTRLTDMAGRGPIARVFAGGRCALSGFAMMKDDAELRKLARRPMWITLACVVVLVVVGFIFGFSPLLNWIGPGPGHWYSFLRYLVGVLLVPLVALVSAFFGIVVASLINCEVMSAISSRTELLLVGEAKSGPSGVNAIARGLLTDIALELARLFVYLLGLLLILFLGLIPVLGQLGAPLLGLLWTWLFLAFEFVGGTLGRHGMGARSQLRTLFAHRLLHTGFGAAAWVILFVPLMAPVMVVGGTRLALSLAAFDHIQSRLTTDEKQRLREA